MVRISNLQTEARESYLSKEIRVASKGQEARLRVSAVGTRPTKNPDTIMLRGTLIVDHADQLKGLRFGDLKPVVLLPKDRHLRFEITVNEVVIRD